MSVNAVEPVVATREDGLNDLADEQLVARSQASGCAESLDELLRRHLRKVRSLVFSMVLNHSRADDLTQEVFLRAIRGLKGFRAEAKFSTWLFRIAWNVLQDERSQRETAFDDAKPLGALASSSDSPDRVALQRELDQQIEAGLAGLSPKLRAAIVLTSLQQLSAEEAAKLEGCSTATMYWRIHEARRQLQARLANYLGGEER